MLGKEDEQFLKTYNADKYEHPSVTVDMLIFTVEDNKLKLMLIKRKNSPYKDHWAIPGGFVNIDESVKTAAERELQEETNMSAFLEEFGVFGEVNRDPRTRVISIGYLALIPNWQFSKMYAGDDAKEVEIFEVTYNNKLQFNKSIELAFDHDYIIRTGIEKLREKLQYTDIAFKLLGEEFTLFDLQKVYEAILGYPLSKSNFRRSIRSKFKLVDTGKVSKKYQRPAKIYRRG